jgi:toxin CcdB
MAQFDIHVLTGDGGLVVDCQSDLLKHIDTRFVLPLLLRGLAPQPFGRLNPVFEIEGEAMVLVTQAAATIETRALGRAITSLAGERYAITNAIGMLLAGI